jgi:hypothetical protein
VLSCACSVVDTDCAGRLICERDTILTPKKCRNPKVGDLCSPTTNWERCGPTMVCDGSTKKCRPPRAGDLCGNLATCGPDLVCTEPCHPPPGMPVCLVTCNLPAAGDRCPPSKNCGADLVCDVGSNNCRLPQAGDTCPSSKNCGPGLSCSTTADSPQQNKCLHNPRWEGEACAGQLTCCSILPSASGSSSCVASGHCIKSVLTCIYMWHLCHISHFITLQDFNVHGANTTHGTESEVFRGVKREENPQYIELLRRISTVSVLRAAQ